MFRLAIQNMRVLRNVGFTCEGFSLLVGPNGSGKTTLLRILHALKIASRQSVRHGFSMRNIRSFSASETDRVGLELCIDETSWQIDFGTTSPDGRSLTTFSETVRHRGRVLSQANSATGVISLPTLSPPTTRSDDQRGALKMLTDVVAPAEIEPLSTWLSSLRIHYVTGGLSSWLHPIWSELEAEATSSVTLEMGYRNVFAVLRNWRDTRKLREPFDRLMTELRALYPREFYELDFKPELGVVPPGHDRVIPIGQMSDGFLSSLLHLTGAVSMGAGGLLIIDQIEDNLHPAAIGGLVAALRRLAHERSFSVLLTTHSPYVLNLFDATPEQVYVLEPSAPVQPVRLTDLHDAAWLSHFRLGNLYGVEFAKQERAATE